MQQQQPQLMAMNPSFPPTNITTEQIQKCLDENKNLILAILDNQNLGKLAECAQYQAQLQKNLMYLAAIADGQPQAPAMHSQMAPHPMMQQGGHYMQNPQAAVPQQPGVFAPKVPLQFNTQQMQDHQLQLQQQQQRQLHHQQAIQGHLGMRPGANNGMHPMTTHGHGGSSDAPPSAAALNEFTRRTGGGGGGGSSVDVRGTKQDAPETGSGDAQGNPAAGHGGVEPLYVKGSEGAN